MTCRDGVKCSTADSAFNKRSDTKTKNNHAFCEELHGEMCCGTVMTATKDFCSASCVLKKSDCQQLTRQIYSDVI